jgi:site-specific DNA-methyltransferase (adenine-specific)
VNSATSSPCLHLGDCLDVLRTLPDCSVDAVVTDPPYGLAFMGKRWDYDVPSVAIWAECLRVLKPGGHLLAFAGTRTQHRMAVRIEDAGFEIRDMIAWVYGSGFPKSLDVSKAIDKAAGAEREVVGKKDNKGRAPGRIACIGLNVDPEGDPITAPATPAAQQWAGFGTALKPSWECITMARKPLGSRAVNVLANVECELRKSGVCGQIAWRQENAKDAVKASNRKSLSLTDQPQAGATSAASAGASVTPSEGTPCETISGQNTQNGERQTASTSDSIARGSENSSEIKCSMPMGLDARAVENRRGTFSHSTTSKEEGPLTGDQSTARSTSSSSATDSPPASESFAGIATGLTGSMAHAHIRRDPEGFFLWPARLPKSVPGAPLTVAANVMEHRTGALNVDGCRVEGQWSTWRKKDGRVSEQNQDSHDVYGQGMGDVRNPEHPAGRWPANLIHDGSDEVVKLFPQTTTGSTGGGTNKMGGTFGNGKPTISPFREGDTGSAARFFYTAKASASERQGVAHPTVKPLDLMAYLCRLVTPPGGVVLDPFMGSGTTIKAAIGEGFQAIGIERDPAYFKMAQHRMDGAQLGLSFNSDSHA